MRDSKCRYKGSGGFLRASVRDSVTVRGLTRVHDRVLSLRFRARGFDPS